MSEPESENDRPKKMAQLARRQFDGIGPTTKDGMPIVLRSVGYPMAEGLLLKSRLTIKRTANIETIGKVGMICTAES